MGNVDYIYDSESLVNTWEALLLRDNEVLTKDVLTAACNEVYKDGYTAKQEVVFNKEHRVAKPQNFFHCFIIKNSVAPGLCVLLVIFKQALTEQVIYSQI